MPTERSPQAQRALRLACGTALCLTVSFGLALPIPFMAPVLALMLLVSLNQPLSFKAGLSLILVALFTTGVGLLLIPILRYYPASGVLLVALALFVVFRMGLRGANGLVVTFLTIGLTLISAAGVADFGLAVTVIEALAKGLFLAMLAVGVSHWLFPDPGNAPSPAGPGPQRTRDYPSGLARHLDRAADLPHGAA